MSATASEGFQGRPAHAFGAQDLLCDKLQHDVAMASAAVSADPDETPASVAVSTRLTKISKRFADCQDNQSSYVGDHNGAFTARLLMVWNRGALAGNYATFRAQIKSGVPAVQTPNLYTMGHVATSLEL